MSIRFQPHEMPHVKQRGPDEWECTLYNATFDHEAYSIEGGCPICADMERAQQSARGGL